MTARRCLNDVEVAAKLGRGRDWFAKNKKRLIEQQGFPPMLPILRRWDEAAIDLWLDRQMPPDLIPLAIKTDEPDAELQEDEADLIARAASLAADQSRPH